MVGGIVDDKMVTAVEGTRGKAKVERSFCGVAVTHEEACSAFGRKFFFVVFYDVAYGTENMKIAVVRTFLVDDEVWGVLVTC